MVRRPSRSRRRPGGRGRSRSEGEPTEAPPKPGARRIAFDVLLRVDRGGAFAGLALDVALRERPDLERRERALATELVYGTLRRALALDEVIKGHATRPLEEMEHRVRVLLRLGAYQLLYLRVPDHAAVGETVALAKAVGASGAAGFVNAVLRALTRAPAAEPPALEADPARHLLLEEGLPAWLYEAWRRQLPLEEVADLARAINQPAPVTLRAASPAHRDEALGQLAEAGIVAHPTRLSPVGIVLEEGAHPETLPGWDALGLQPQDEGAQLVTEYALLPGASPEAPARILDACAAPGGKTCHLAQALPGASLVATDLHRRRIARVGQEAARLGLDARMETHAADATHPLPFAKAAEFDLVLLDAPCTGFGTLRRHPEIKLTRTAEDVGRLAELQDRLLDNLAGYVAPGGRLVYAVCTSTLAEGPERVARFLKDHPEFEVDPPILPVARVERTGDGPGPDDATGPDAPPWETLLGPDGTLSTWTHRHGVDGFFAARLRRR